MKLNERYGKTNAHYMKRLEEITRYAMEDYARVLAFRVDLRLPVDNQHKGYDSTVITRFIASLKAQIAAYLNKRRREGKRIYPCKLRYVWVKEFGEEKGNKHYHMLLLVNREVFRNTALTMDRSAQYRGLLVGMVARAWAVALKRTGDMADKAPFHLPGVSYELDRRNGTNTDFYRSYIYHISYLAKEYTKNHDDGERNFGCSQG
ncbi:MULTISPECIES: inovirus Gp2 family protein [Photorhabdus]|uniref:Malate transporter n=1 Tax=Photorhabdus thracensis TaxID=230089 RepID=A0A0F7LMZ9_9GAMM|nr:inovirus Gp2 family protein [Photorhabdus thracensis]AKH63398.1 malate transporter [Photorhabdus thracensis]